MLQLFRQEHFGQNFDYLTVEKTLKPEKSQRWATKSNTSTVSLRHLLEKWNMHLRLGLNIDICLVLCFIPNQLSDATSLDLKWGNRLRQVLDIHVDSYSELALALSLLVSVSEPVESEALLPSHTFETGKEQLKHLSNVLAKLTISHIIKT